MMRDVCILLTGLWGVWWQVGRYNRWTRSDRQTQRLLSSSRRHPSLPRSRTGIVSATQSHSVIWYAFWPKVKQNDAKNSFGRNDDPTLLIFQTYHSSTHSLKVIQIYTSVIVHWQPCNSNSKSQVHILELRGKNSLETRTVMIDYMRIFWNLFMHTLSLCSRIHISYD